MLQLAACGGQQNAQPTAAPTQAATAPAATAPATAAVAEEPTPGPDEFVNPVIDQDFPDPDALKVDDTYYVYATNAAGANTQTARSTDLVSWEMLGDALPTLPAWALSGYTWAPEVTTSADGQTFVMYFTARDSASGKQCIGVATSEAPAGPFTSDAEQPLICQLDEGGSIDASAFVDEDGERYVLWKNDGNCCSLPVYLYLQPVSDDGLTLEGEPTQLITNDQAWEGNLVEAPTLWRNADTYYLFYSANNYAGVDYAVGYAVADAITGPYTKPSAAPLLATDFGEGDALGPGGQDIVVVEDGETWMLYHSWNSDASYRRLQIDELVWEGETPVVQGPDTNPQPRPFE
jgi:beta-xylosidase